MSIYLICTPVDPNVSNAWITIETAYFAPEQGLESEPEWVQFRIGTTQEPYWERSVCIPFQALSVASLLKECPFLRIHKRKEIDQKLLETLRLGLGNGHIARGYFLSEPGVIHFSDGTIGFLRGQELIGVPKPIPYFLSPQIRDLHLAGSGTVHPRDLAAQLLMAPPQVLLVLAYVILSSVRSLVIGYGMDYQAVLYIVGGQGLGKTTLAARVAGIYQRASDGKPAGFVQAGSSKAGTEMLLSSHRDQPVIIDDLCLSAGKETARKRLELGAALIRQGAGEIPIVRKKGSIAEAHKCVAGVILTAEFSLENMSDLTRCLIVPVDEPLRLSDGINPELVGDVIRGISKEFSTNSRYHLRRLAKALEGPRYPGMEARVRTNYLCLRWAFHALLHFWYGRGVYKDTLDALSARMEEGLELALIAHEKHRKELLSRVPAGNLAWVILEGLRKGGFDLTKKIEKLPKRGGILWKDDLCLRPEELVRFVRLQPGYQEWTRNRITRTLKDWGALVIQEEVTDTVWLRKCEKGSGFPRVYRIRLKVLEDQEERY